ncbi:hypothetical protein AGMMS4957_18280 [Bacteroidia bacterium]|nr:hypothetical protein AGMMS4957_18280 [Bacteroidia bacterium]
MKHIRKYRLLFTLLIACSSLTGWGQGASYPVQVMTQLTPPYSLILSDYAKPASQKLFVTIMVRDLNIVNLPVRLHIKMETLSGMTVETVPNIITPAIYLTGGLVTMLYGSDLTDYFNINNLQFKGYSKEDYRRTGQLPEGHYRITVEVRHWATGRIISSQGTAYTWMALGKPPVLKVPEDKAEMGKIPGMPLTFSWIPNKVGIPGVIPQYKFEMWEMRIPGINPNVVAASMPTFYTTTQLITNLVIHPATLNFEPGLEYAWRVTAFDPIGDVSFEQGGHSVIRTFTYQCKCEGVSDVKLERKGQNVAVSWNQIPNTHTSFHLEMENQASGWSATDVVYYNKANSGQLVVGQTYRMRVRAICDGNTMNPSEPTAWQTITIPEPPKRDNSKCGTPVKSIPVTNYTLRTDLQAGDFLTHPKSGGSRYTIKTATPQGDGKFKGIFVSWWGWAGDLKIPCEYWDLSVNTDNQILTMKYHSISKAAFLLDVDAAKAKIENVTDAVTNLANTAADAVAKLTTNTQVKNSVEINAPLKGAFINEDKQLVVVTENPDGTLTETVQPTDKMDATLVKGSDGEEYVVTSDGKMMGKEEFAATGGNSRMVDKQNEEKEAKANPSVTFVASPEQKYGFDSYAESKSAIQNEYPELKSGYRPPFKSVESFKTDKVQTNNTDKDVTFRTEMGVPVTESGRTLTVRGSYDGDEQALYAYAGKNETETVVGKLNVLSFDTKKKKVYLVSVNNANLPNAMTLQQELNRIYAPAVVSWAVQNAKAVSVTFAKGKMTHGGSSTLSVYNADQKAVIKAFGSMEKDALYLFFVNSVQGKEGVNGYMPMQYQSGFIYDNTNAVTVAHELAHGAFNLAHTFSSEKFIAAQGGTDNLLDYKGGDKLWKHQWKLVNNPQSMFLKFLQDETDAESQQIFHPIALNKIVNLATYNLGEKINYITPDGRIIALNKSVKPSFTGIVANHDAINNSISKGVLLGFVENGQTYVAVFTGNSHFNGYYKQDEFSDEKAVYVVEKSEGTVTKKILAGIEQDDCNLQLKTFDYSNELYYPLSASTGKAFITSSIVPNTATTVGNVLIADCKFTSKGQEVVATLNRTGFSEYADWVNKIGLLVSENKDEKYDDFIKIATDGKTITTQDQAALERFYNSLDAYYKAHAEATLVTNSNCPTCPKYPIEGDAYWDEAGRNWLMKDGKWIDLSGEFGDNAAWKQDIDVQAVHKQFYDYKLYQQKTNQLRGLGYTDKELFEKTLWRSTQYLVVRTLKEQWAANEVGNEIWIPVYGSLSKAYFLGQVSEGDMMLKTQAGFDAVFGISDVFVVKALATGLFKFTVWAGEKLVGQDIYYLAKKQLLTARLSFILSTEAPQGATTFLKKQGDNIVEIVNKESSRFIKYDLQTGEMLVCRYSDNVEKTLQLTYEDFRTISVNTAGLSEDGVVEAIVKTSTNLPSTIRQIVSKPTYQPLRTIWSKDGKTTTFIGKWREDVAGQENGLQKVYNELSSVKGEAGQSTTDLNVYMLSGKFDNPGGFNLLSIEGYSTTVVEAAAKKGIKPNTKAFEDFIWETYNQPWIENALQRGDDIVLWSDPTLTSNLEKLFEIEDIYGKSFYGREIDFIQNNATKYGYDFNNGISSGIFTKQK